MGWSPIQIDILCEADGIDFESCYKRCQQTMINDLKIAVISREDLIKNKKASGRFQDLADAEQLENE